MTVDGLTIEREGSLLVLTMRRPPHNYFDGQVLTALADALQAVDGDPDVRCSLLLAEGRSFCAGADFRASSGGQAGDIYVQAARMFDRRKPLVAAVQGAAVGGGLGLALAADFRVAAPEARFQANFVRIGLHPGFALTTTLPRIVGRQVAADLFLTGRSVSGDEAVALGLADRLANSEGLHAAARALAAEIASGAPLALLSIRAAIQGDLADEVRLAMARELETQRPLFATSDFREGVTATAERRSPQFTGR